MFNIKRFFLFLLVFLTFTSLTFSQRTGGSFGGSSWGSRSSSPSVSSPPSSIPTSSLRTPTSSSWSVRPTASPTRSGLQVTKNISSQPPTRERLTRPLVNPNIDFDNSDDIEEGLLTRYDNEDSAGASNPGTDSQFVKFFGWLILCSMGFIIFGFVYLLFTNRI